MMKILGFHVDLSYVNSYHLLPSLKCKNVSGETIIINKNVWKKQ